MKLNKVAWEKICAALLYALPIIFFTVVYFLQVTSSEDIAQGAARPLAIIPDALAAFHWSARLGDMYSWSMINFFDYRYSFGIDTVFRLFDAFLAGLIFFMMIKFVLGRNPRLKVQDALLFCTAFLAVFLSEYSRSLMSSFSQIHNYLLIAVLALVFIWPFVRTLRGQVMKSSTLSKTLMIIAGFLFGFSSNVTPVVFLITFAVVLGYQKLKLHKKFHFKRWLRSWQPFAFAGIVIAFFVMYVLGPGFSQYTQGYNPSYVSIGSLLMHPSESVKLLFSNIMHNTMLITPLLLLMVLTVFFEYAMYRKRIIKEKIPGVGFSVACLTFFVVHVLAVSQIDVTSTTRLLLPAYICVVISVFFTINRLMTLIDVRQRTLLGLSCLVILVSVIITVDITVGMVKYSHQAAVVLNRIKDAPAQTVCVTPEDNPTMRAKSPLLGYYQRDLFTDWAMPETVYGRHVNWCK